MKVRSLVGRIIYLGLLDQVINNIWRQAVEEGKDVQPAILPSDCQARVSLIDNGLSKLGTCSGCILSLSARRKSWSQFNKDSRR